MISIDQHYISITSEGIKNVHFCLQINKSAKQVYLFRIVMKDPDHNTTLIEPLNRHN